MWRQCAHSAVLPGVPLCSRSGRSTPPCTRGHGRCDETLQDCIPKSVSYVSENPSCSNSFYSWYRWFFTSIKWKKWEEIFVKLKHVVWSRAGRNVLLPVAFLTKMHLSNNSFFQYDYIFVLISMCCFAKAHWTFFLCLIPYIFSQTQRHYSLS